MQNVQNLIMCKRVVIAKLSTARLQARNKHIWKSLPVSKLENSFSNLSQSLQSLEILHMECLVFSYRAETVYKVPYPRCCVDVWLQGQNYACSCVLPLPTLPQRSAGGGREGQSQLSPPQLSSFPSRLKSDVLNVPLELWRKSVYQKYFLGIIQNFILFFPFRATDLHHNSSCMDNLTRSSRAEISQTETCCENSRDTKPIANGL